ncbi:hypothetical protein [Paracoccus sp. (in: a-proteobacteria)]|uniref:hypothetical protein n=1 Tax=Paracoccus sp. TaxID=267 RepID=UPI0026E0D128|nr:hypothetical protein [Paracoccus sp. (in: a-proteobacteria)]MDO5647440.1 hypothetical protein [Paracoccus sp. (in: a-proteobacteria)]
MTGVGADVLGVIAVGVGMAALMYAAVHAARKAGLTPPKWAIPAGIGLAMVVYSVWNDYAWAGRAIARLPSDAAVLAVGRTAQPWAPWTFVLPVGVRVAAIDPASITDQPDGTRMAQITLVERRGQTIIVPQQFDCAAARVKPARGDWAQVPGDDPALLAVCHQGGSHGQHTGDRG